MYTSTEYISQPKQMLKVLKRIVTMTEAVLLSTEKQMSWSMRFPIMWYVRPAKPQISLRICAV